MSTQIKDQKGSLIAELIKNEWKIAPPPQTWDRNYSKDALEVINPKGDVVLQVRALDDRVQIQGEWWADAVRGTRIVKSQDTKNPGGLMIFFGPKHPLGIPGDDQIVRMFRYPSELHFGELR